MAKKKNLTFDFFTPDEDNTENYEVVEPVQVPLMQFPAPYEPKRNNRFILQLPEELGIEEWLVQSVPRPRLRGRTEHINGGYDFPPFWIRFRDPIGPSTSQKLWDLYMGLNTSNLENDMVHEATIEDLRTRFDNIRRFGMNMNLKMLDPTGVVVEHWEILGCTVLDFDFGNLDYGDDSVASCGIRVKPRNVILRF